MPIYKANEMKETPDVKRPHISMIQYGGDLIKAGLVTYYEGDAPPPHYHPNDEQWIYFGYSRSKTHIYLTAEIISE